MNIQTLIMAWAKGNAASLRDHGREIKLIGLSYDDFAWYMGHCQQNGPYQLYDATPQNGKAMFRNCRVYGARGIKNDQIITI